MLRYSFKRKKLLFDPKNNRKKSRLLSLQFKEENGERLKTSCNVNAVEAGRKLKVHYLNSKIGE
jgi:hypothetical protein